MVRRSVVAIALLCGLVAACGGDDAPPKVDIYVDGTSEAVIAELIGFTPGQRFRVATSSDPVAQLDDTTLRIAVVADLDCTECYRIERAGAGYVVHGDAPLGVQYGLTHLLEQLGFRFFQPWYSEVPDQLAGVSDQVLGSLNEPEVRLRGIHLHTIHPVESYYLFWEPGDHLDEVKRVIDWIVKNRGNYVEWVALDDIQKPGADPSAWREHTKAIVDYAHARGLSVGLGIQLFGASNLQQGFDLTDSEDTSEVPRAEIRSRLPVLDGLGFDRIHLSFGEFFGTDPQFFIDTLNAAYEEMVALWPDIDVVTKIHVGNSADQRVDYMGQNIIFYFLVQWADPGIVPWIHTVMYYNLFDDAGGAYHHDDFSEHREYLFDRLRAGERVGYYPETAYWVAFDNSVPTYLPLYVRSRWLDLHEIRARAVTDGHADLEEHVLFSSGWVWGYWQNDYASLRASYHLPESDDQLFRDMFSAWGEPGVAVADRLAELADVQYTYLIEQRLAAYLAARDFYIDLGREIDIVSQPDRPLFSEVAAWDATQRGDFTRDVVEPLEQLAGEHERILAAVQNAGMDPNVRWHREIVDGLEVTIERVRYIALMFRAVLAFAETGDDGGYVAMADEALARARVIVDRRHADIVYPDPEKLIFWNGNATLYQWGYLTQAHDLCYWKRERVEATNVIDGANESVPLCIY